MVAVNALGYNHFVVFRGVMGDRVLVADPAWGNRTMTIDKFQRMWLDYGEPVGHVGFVVERANGAEVTQQVAAETERLCTAPVTLNRDPRPRSDGNRRGQDAGSIRARKPVCSERSTKTDFRPN